MTAAQLIIGLASGAALGVTWKWLDDTLGEKAGYTFVLAAIAAAIALTLTTT